MAFQFSTKLTIWYKGFFISLTLEASLRDKVTKFNDSLQFSTANEKVAMFRTSPVHANTWFRHCYAHMRLCFDTLSRLTKIFIKYHFFHVTVHSHLKMLHMPSLKLLLFSWSSMYHPIFKIEFQSHTLYTHQYHVSLPRLHPDHLIHPYRHCICHAHCAIWQHWSPMAYC